MAAEPATRRGASIGRLRSGQWLALTAGGLALVALLGVVASLIALNRLTDARVAVVDRADPARVLSGQYLNGLVNQETGIRGYALSGRREFLAPYDDGGVDAARARRGLQTLTTTGDLPRLRGELARVDAAVDTWRTGYAVPAALSVGSGGAVSVRSVAQLRRGKALFDRVRGTFAVMDTELAAVRADARRRLRAAAGDAHRAVIFTGVLVLLAALAAAVTLRRTVGTPLARLAHDARVVARGDFGHEVAIQGPRDVVGLSTDVDSMRRKILAELEAAGAARALLEEQAVELQRSNAELEQFAYVASHDLQEPLRKVASFTGMLQHRYQGQLDERADQYIDFAVDGAKRMQVLINDLLAFSRVGRVGTEQVALELDAVAADAVGNLESAIADAGAAVTVDGPLPRVVGDRSLLTALLQNLIANGIKFHAEDDDAPRVRLSVARTGDTYTFAVDDNGIGIAPRYADRIFVIFQRLHPKEEYSGTGIGLAMCRKIVEFHGGEIRLEPEGADGGASFRFTLPVPEEDPSP